MTPQEFVDTLEPPETLRHVAIVAYAPLYSVAQWLSAVRSRAGVKYDRWDFRINPMRLHGYIDGVSEPRLAITFHDPMENGQTPRNAPSADAIIIRDLVL